MTDRAKDRRGIIVRLASPFLADFSTPNSPRRRSRNDTGKIHPVSINPRPLLLRVQRDTIDPPVLRTNFEFPLSKINDTSRDPDILPNIYKRGNTARRRSVPDPFVRALFRPTAGRNLANDHSRTCLFPLDSSPRTLSRTTYTPVHNLPARGWRGRGTEAQKKRNTRATRTPVTFEERSRWIRITTARNDGEVVG